MPINFQFAKADGSLANLDEVDREMCEVSGQPYSKSNYCAMFTFLTQTIGLGVLRVGNGSSATPEAFDAYKAAHDARPVEDQFGLTDEEWVATKDFLTGRYTYSAWSSR